MPLRNLPVPLRRSLAWIVGMSAGHGRLSTAALLGAVSRPMTPTEDSQNKAGMFFRISASSLRVLLEEPVSQAQVGGPSRSNAEPGSRCTVGVGQREVLRTKLECSLESVQNRRGSSLRSEVPSGNRPYANEAGMPGKTTDCQKCAPPSPVGECTQKAGPPPWWGRRREVQGREP